MKIKPMLNRVAGTLAFIIGLMAIFAGGKVLLGTLPDYYVIDWLLIYNFVMGIATAFFIAILIWKNHQLAVPAAITTFSLHTVVMVVLQTAYHQVVAPDSIRAMTVRMVIWAVILVLLFVQYVKNKKRSQA